VQKAEHSSVFYLLMALGDVRIELIKITQQDERL